MRIYYNPRLKKLAKYLRNNSTYSEIILWNEIKAKKLGFGFLRQKPIGNYIVDFYCPKLRLAIEVDGMVHNFKRNQIRDRRKSLYLKKLGIHLLRFTNFQVLNNTNSVLALIKTNISQRQDVISHSPSPLSKGEHKEDVKSG